MLELDSQLATSTVKDKNGEEYKELSFHDKKELHNYVCGLQHPMSDDIDHSGTWSLV